MNSILPIEHLVFLVAGLAVLAAVSAWITGAAVPARIRAPAAIARLAGLGCLALIAFNPGHWEKLRDKAEKSWVVMIDRSASMQVEDADAQTRWARARGMADTVARLGARNWPVYVHPFSDELESASAHASLSAATPDGNGTDIVGAGISLLDRYAATSTRLAGLILISDGRQVAAGDADSLAIRARSQDCPVYAVPVGGDVPRRDLSVSTPRRQYVGFVGQPIRIAAELRNEGLGRITVPVRLDGADDKVIDTVDVRIDGDRTVPATFKITLDKPGYNEYSLSAPEWPGESSSENNLVRIGVLGIAEEIRVFLAEGVPHWDSKFLVQLLRKQKHVKVTSVYRVASDRFFLVDNEPSGVSESSQPPFPDSDGELAKYDVVVFGKGAEYFLTPERVRLLRDFLRNSGGSVIFARGKPYSGRFKDLETIEPVSWHESVDMPFRFKPTDEGEQEGLFGQMLPGSSDGIWAVLPELHYANRVTRETAFTHVLAAGEFNSAGSTSQLPLIVSRRYGKGVVVTVNMGGLWQWGFFPSVREAGNMYAELWIQLFQWAGTYSEFLPGNDFSLQLAANSVAPGEPVRARVTGRLKSERTDPGGMSGLSVMSGRFAPRLTVYRGETQVAEFTAAPQPEVAGIWDAILDLAEPGTYRVILENGGDAGSRNVCATLHVRQPASESDNQSADPAFMRKLAETAGGRILAEADLEKLMGQPARETADLDETANTVWVPHWDRWWILIGAAACLSAEWFMRRRNGLL